jgi:hypothetical protein
MPGYDYDDEDQQQDEWQYDTVPYSSQSAADESYGGMCEDVGASEVSSWDGGGMCGGSVDSPGIDNSSIADWGAGAPPEAGHEEDQWSGGGIGWGMTPDVADVAMPGVGHYINEGAEEIAGGAEASGALGIITGPAGMATGIQEYREGVESGNVNQAVQGGLGTAAGTASTIEGVGTIAAYGLGDSAAAATVGGVAADFGAAAPPLAAGAVGFGIGTSIAHVADSDATKDGTWGVDESGNNQSAMDWGASWGTDYDKAHNDGQPSVVGGVLAGVGGIVGGFGGAEQVAWNWLTEDD